VLQEEFPDVGCDLIVLALQTAVYDIDEASECFQSSKLLSTLRTDLNQIRNCTSDVYRFLDSISASPSPPALYEDAAMIPWPMEDRQIM
jgi:hypothetical protein